MVLNQLLIFSSESYWLLAHALITAIYSSMYCALALVQCTALLLQYNVLRSCLSLCWWLMLMSTDSDVLTLSEILYHLIPKKFLSRWKYYPGASSRIFRTGQSHWSTIYCNAILSTDWRSLVRVLLTIRHIVLNMAKSIYFKHNQKLRTNNWRLQKSIEIQILMTFKNRLKFKC